MRFEFRVLDDNGDEIASDWTTIEPDWITEFGGCETVEIHVASALRYVRKTVREDELEDA